MLKYYPSFVNTKLVEEKISIKKSEFCGGVPTDTFIVYR